MLKENQEQHPLRGVFVCFMSGFVSKTPSPDIKQTTAQWAVVALDFLRGGERGIRTLDTLLRCTHFPGALLKPLGHLSIFNSSHHRLARNRAQDKNNFCFSRNMRTIIFVGTTTTPQKRPPHPQPHRFIRPATKER